MASHPLSPRVRRKLQAILAEDRPEAAELLAALRGLREVADASPFSAAVELLLAVRMADRDAERLLGGILDHRSSLRSSLGRDPGLRVAAADYFFELRAGSGSLEGTSAPSGEDEAENPTWDPASGLAGSHAFSAELEREIRRSRRHGLGFALVRVDFSGVLGSARSFGRLLCDEVLKNAARAMRRALREADRAGRIAEEEFGLLLPETDRVGARAAAERVLATLAASASSHGPDGAATSPRLAAGAACFPADGLTADSLQDRAAEALRRARGTAGVRVEVHHVERRSFARRAPGPALFADLSCDDGDTPRAAEPLNLSRSGILLDTFGQYRSQERVVVRLSVVRDGGSSSRVALPGRVVRVEPRGDPARGARIGIAFERPLVDDWPTEMDAPPPSASRTRN